MRAACAGALLGALLALPLAPSPARADDAAMARFHYEEAGRHYAQRRYEAAIQQFFLAQRLSPNPRTLYNIGLCFVQLERREEAHQFLGEYLSQPDEVEGAEERRAFARRTLEEMAPSLALVEVRSEPAGARIFVDREEHGAYGRTPRVIAVQPGARRIWVELEGHRRAEAEVAAVRGEPTAVTLQTPRIEGTLALSANTEARARVVDAEGAVAAEGALPLTRALPPGRYDVEVSAEGRQPTRAIVLVEDGETATLAVTLATPTAELTVTANRLDARVALDGSPAGRAPLPLSGITPGVHRLRVAAEGAFPWEGELALEPDARAWVTVSLEEQPAGRSIWTWIVGGGGLALLAAGAATGIATLALHDSLIAMRDEGPAFRDTVSVQPFADEVDALAATTDVLLATGALAFGAALVIFFVSDPDLAPRSTASVTRSER